MIRGNAYCAPAPFEAGRDPIHQLAFEHIRELRCDAARGRGYKTTAATAR
jgi:hypothetical protein